MVNFFLTAFKTTANAYCFAKSTQKLLFIETKGVAFQRLKRLVSASYTLLTEGVCSLQQLQKLSFLIQNVNSNSLKFWFTELSLIGLGFRFSVKDFGSSFRLNIGYSHAILIPILPNLFLLKRKKRCLVVSSSLSNLRTFVAQMLHFRKTSVYKLKGLQLKGVSFKLKPGKRSK